MSYQSFSTLPRNQWWNYNHCQNVIGLLLSKLTRPFPDCWGWKQHASQTETVKNVPSRAAQLQYTNYRQCPPGPKFTKKETNVTAKRVTNFYIWWVSIQPTNRMLQLFTDIVMDNNLTFNNNNNNNNNNKYRSLFGSAASHQVDHRAVP